MVITIHNPVFILCVKERILPGIHLTHHDYLQKLLKTVFGPISIITEIQGASEYVLRASYHACERWGRPIQDAVMSIAYSLA